MTEQIRPTEAMPPVETPPASAFKLPLSPTVLTVMMAIGYYIAARLSLLLQVQPENIAVFWPAAGISVGALIALGRGARVPIAIAVVIATLIANIEHGAQPLVALIFAACNAIECLVAAAILERLFGFPVQLDSLRRVLGLVAATLIATALAAAPAAWALAVIAAVPVPLAVLWRTWLESDAVGIVTVAPLLMALPAALRERLPLSRLIEGGVVLLLVIGTAVDVVSSLPTESSWPTLIPLGLLFPLLLWLAARCPPIFAAAGAFAIALSIVYCVTSGLGALGQGPQPLPDRIFIAQVAMLTLSLCALALSAVIAEQRAAEAQLRTKEQRLRIATQAARLGVFEWYIKQDRAVWENDRMYEIFAQQKSEGTLSFAQLVQDYIDPEYREQIFSNRQRSNATGEVSSITRIRRRDGVWRDIEIIGVVEKDDFGEPERVVGVMADITERRRSEERQALLIGELDHRVKNALERVATLISSTRRNATGIDDFVEALTGRIHSMARAHQLLSRERWSGVDLAALVAEHLDAYDAPGRIVVEGPDVKLTAEATQALSMVMHELATNAAKYGALSTGDGRVHVIWKVGCGSSEKARDTSLQIDWIEKDGPVVKPPSRTGFGSKVIREPIVYELGGRVDLAFPPEGVRCHISVPMDRVASQ